MWNSVVTNAGISLLSQWAQGGTLAITGAKAGTGTIPTAQLMAATNMAGTAITLGIVRYAETEDGVEYVVQIRSAASAYTAKQIGIWASLNDGPNTLIAIYQTDGSGIEIPAYTDMPEFSIEFSAAVQMDNTGTLTVTIDQTASVNMETLLSYLSEKADADSVYSKGEVDAALADKADSTDVYTKNEVDAALQDKADASDVYDKSTIDETIRQITVAISGKANASDVYGKNETYSQTEVDDAMALKADAQDVYSKTDTYNKTEVDTAMTAKASRNIFTATIPISGWVDYQSALFTVTVPVVGVLATDSCGNVGVEQTGTESTDKEIRKAWNRITRIVAAADGIVVYASKVPTVAIPIRMEIFR